VAGHVVVAGFGALILADEQRLQLAVQIVSPARLRRRFVGAPGAGLDQIAGDIDAQDVGAKPGFRHGGRAVAAAQIEHLESGRDPERRDEGFSAPPHRLGDACEVALFPQRVVRIDGCAHVWPRERWRITVGVQAGDHDPQYEVSVHTSETPGGGRPKVSRS